MSIKSYREGVRPKMKPTSLDHRNLPLLMLKAREQVIARFRPLLAEHDLTEQQWRIIRVLLEAGPLEPREIGEMCGLSSPSLAGVLLRMDELGLVVRERFANDQRRVRVSLSARCRALTKRIIPQVESTYAALEAHLGKQFCETLYMTLDELILKLKDHDMERR
jgi:homoprotocatechuate degradation regulator HpaR